MSIALANQGDLVTLANSWRPCEKTETAGYQMTLSGAEHPPSHAAPEAP